MALSQLSTCRLGRLKAFQRVSVEPQPQAKGTVRCSAYSKQNDDMQDLYRMKALALEDLNRRARAKLQLYPAEVREKIEAAIQAEMEKHNTGNGASRKPSKNARQSSAASGCSAGKAGKAGKKK